MQDWFSCEVDRKGTQKVYHPCTLSQGEKILHEDNLANKITHEELQMRKQSCERQADGHGKPWKYDPKSRK